MADLKPTRECPFCAAPKAKTPRMPIKLDGTCGSVYSCGSLVWNDGTFTRDTGCHRATEAAKDATLERMQGLLAEAAKELQEWIDAFPDSDWGAMLSGAVISRIEAELAERSEELEGAGDG